MELLILIWLVAIVAAVAIGNSKGRPALDSFMFGLVLGWIGVILIAILPAPAPKGMRSVKCPRCDAKQNIEHGKVKFDCWQCHQTVDV
jgi:hypothetical protein